MTTTHTPGLVKRLKADAEYLRGYAADGYREIPAVGKRVAEAAAALTEMLEALRDIRQVEPISDECREHISDLIDRIDKRDA